MTTSIGQAAPNFTLYADNGDQVTLSELCGTPVVLAFFPAAFTGVCETELCSLRDSMGSYNDIDAKVLGISVDSRFVNAAFVAANQLNFQVLSDYTRSTIDAYGIRFADLADMPGYDVAQRSVFVIDATGTVSWRWLADNPGEQPPYDEVLAAVRELTSPA